MAKQAREMLLCWEDIATWTKGSLSRDSPLSTLVEALMAARYDLPDHSPAFSRLDAVLLPLYSLQRDMDSVHFASQLELPGKLTISENFHRAALDDLLCTVFYDATTVYIAADQIGFRYLAEWADNSYPTSMDGILYGSTDRCIVHAVVESFPIVYPVVDKLRKLQVVMLYDTGSSLTYLTRDVLNRLGCQVDANEVLAADQTFDVRINGSAHKVGLCPKERCQHVCLLGQRFLSDGKMVATTNYKTRAVNIEKAP